MTGPGRVLRVVLVAAAMVVLAEVVSHRLLREPRCTPDHRMGADGGGFAARPPGPGSSR